MQSSYPYQTSRVQLAVTFLKNPVSTYLQAGENAVGDSQGDPDSSHVLEEELDIISEDSNLGPKTNHQAKESSGSLPLSLDQAILKSIEACPTEDMKKKMYSTILIVGSGFKFRHADRFLMQKLALQVRTNFSTSGSSEGTKI